MIKRSDGRWQEQLKLPGMSKPKYFYGSTQKEVRKKIAEWNAAEKESGRFEKVAEAWSVWHADRVSYNASEAYRTALQRTIDHFRGRPVDTIGADEIDAYIQYLAGRGYSRRTVQQYRDLLNMIFNYAIVHRMATVNPVGAVKLPAGLPKTRREIPLTSSCSGSGRASIWSSAFLRLCSSIPACGGENCWGCAGRMWTGPSA